LPDILSQRGADQLLRISASQAPGKVTDNDSFFDCQYPFTEQNDDIPIEKSNSLSDGRYPAVRCRLSIGAYTYLPGIPLKIVGSAVFRDIS